MFKIADLCEKEAPLAAELLRCNFYVDDCAGGAHTIEEAVEKYNQITKQLGKHQLQLRKWMSNSPAFLQYIPIEHQETKATAELANKTTVKALGLHWNPQSDSLSYTLTLPERAGHATKRTFLSDYSMLFDPLGMMAPVLVLPKIMLQHIWLKKIAWDDELSPDINDGWQRLRIELQNLKGITIPRWLGTSVTDINTTLHGFCDASEQAYAAVIYLRVENCDQTINTSIVAAKTKVAPIKRISLPRLELCGAYLLALLMQKISKLFPGARIYAYTDSMATLGWINGHPSAWKCFIGNRTTVIQEIIPSNQWTHVRSALNPADCASRGMVPQKLADHKLWWQGPEFLLEDSSKWPSNKPVEISAETDVERRPNYKPCFATAITNDNIPLIALLRRYSWMNRLLRGTAYLIRFSMGVKQPGLVTTDERWNACNMWIRIIQRHFFPAEIQAIKSNDTIDPRSKLIMWTPFIDGEGILRVGGRLENTEMPYEEKHPAILPVDNPFTDLIIKDAHLKTMHGGSQLTAQFIRQKYCIIRGKKAISKHIHKCIACFRYKAKTAKQLMGQLPSPRVQMSPPFSHCGVDYAGPFEVKSSLLRKAPYIKCYIAVFVCLTTKAFHIELVEDMTTRAFVAAYRRLCARRGIPAHIYMDNGSYFHGAANEMPQLLLDANDEETKEVISTLSNQGTQFHFIPPYSPHFGGLWEAGVRSVKHHLRRVLGNSRLRFPEFVTILVQIESMLNSRPLCPLSNDPDDLQVLTPAHFLIGRTLCMVPNPDLRLIPENRLNVYQKAQRITQQFWSIWHKEYLHRLQQRPKWNNVESNIRVNQLVLIREDNVSPSHWPKGRIVATTEGKDGLVRVVQVRTEKGIYTRPIHKVCLLPTSDNESLNEPEFVQRRDYV